MFYLLFVIIIHVIVKSCFLSLSCFQSWEAGF